MQRQITPTRVLMYVISRPKSTSVNKWMKLKSHSTRSRRIFLILSNQPTTENEFHPLQDQSYVRYTSVKHVPFVFTVPCPSSSLYGQYLCLCYFYDCVISHHVTAYVSLTEAILNTKCKADVCKVYKVFISLTWNPQNRIGLWLTIRNDLKIHKLLKIVHLW